MIASVVKALQEAAADTRWSPSAEAVEVGPYSVVAELARHLVAQAKNNRSEGFAQVFRAVEVELQDPNAEARDLLIVGFLEDLQTLSLNDGLTLESWLPWLGPESRASWSAVERYWAGELPADAFNAFVAGTEE